MKRLCHAWFQLVAALAVGALLAGCFHVLVQENVAKGKFSKKYNCPYKNISVVEDDVNVQGDEYKLVGCGVTAYYEGTEETLSSK